MKVFIVMQDNGESYEDYSESIVGVYSTKEKAIEAIKSKGFTERTAKCGYKDSFDKEIEDDWGYCLTISSWIIEEEVDKDESREAN